MGRKVLRLEAVQMKANGLPDYSVEVYKYFKSLNRFKNTKKKSIFNEVFFNNVILD